MYLEIKNTIGDAFLDAITRCREDILSLEIQISGAYLQCRALRPPKNEHPLTNSEFIQANPEFIQALQIKALLIREYQDQNQLLEQLLLSFENWIAGKIVVSRLTCRPFLFGIVSQTDFQEFRLRHGYLRTHGPRSLLGEKIFGGRVPKFCAS